LLHNPSLSKNLFKKFNEVGYDFFNELELAVKDKFHLRADFSDIEA
jgi:hypothetical protein